MAVHDLRAVGEYVINDYLRGRMFEIPGWSGPD